MLRLEKRALPSRTAMLAAPFVAVAFTLVVTSLLVAWAGAPVGRAYALLLEGETDFDVRANASQRVTAALWPVSPDACARVDLQLLDSEGRLLTENRYRHPFRPTLRPRGYPWKFDPDLGMKVFDHPSAPSLADHNIPRPLRAVPLSVRENATEWLLRQRFPRWLASHIARVADFLLS